MNKILLVILCTFGFFGGILAVGYATYGIPGALGAFVLFCVGVKLLMAHIKQKFVGFGKSLFDAKSKVLRDAAVTVHDVKSAPKVEAELIDDEEQVASSPPETKFYFLDVTIAPKQCEDGCTPFQCWDCTELEVVSFDAPDRSMDDDEIECDVTESCHVHNVELLESSDSMELDDAGKEQGPQKLRLHVEVPKHLTRLKFQYYFESFGDIRVP